MPHALIHPAGLDAAQEEIRHAADRRAIAATACARPPSHERRVEGRLQRIAASDHALIERRWTLRPAGGGVHRPAATEVVGLVVVEEPAILTKRREVDVAHEDAVEVLPITLAQRLREGRGPRCGILLEGVREVRKAAMPRRGQLELAEHATLKPSDFSHGGNARHGHPKGRADRSRCPRDDLGRMRAITRHARGERVGERIRGSTRRKSTERLRHLERLVHQVPECRARESEGPQCDIACGRGTLLISCRERRIVAIRAVTGLLAPLAETIVKAGEADLLGRAGNRRHWQRVVECTRRRRDRRSRGTVIDQPDLDRAARIRADSAKVLEARGEVTILQAPLGPRLRLVGVLLTARMQQRAQRGMRVLAVVAPQRMRLPSRSGQTDIEKPAGFRCRRAGLCVIRLGAPGAHGFRYLFALLFNETK